MATPSFADQIRSNYKRDQILFQYLLNENTGTSFADTSTHSYTAKFNGTGNAIIRGKTGYAISTSGSGGMGIYSPGDGSDDNVIQDFTFIASVRPRSGAVGTSCILCKNDDAGNTVIFGFRQHFLYMNWALLFDPDSVPVIQSPVMVSSNTWHFVAFRRKAGAVKDLFLDGKLMIRNATTPATYNSAIGKNGNFELMTNSSGANNNVIGDLDEATWYRTYIDDGVLYQFYREWVGRKKLRLQ